MPFKQQLFSPSYLNLVKNITHIMIKFAQSAINVQVHLILLVFWENTK